MFKNEEELNKRLNFINDAKKTHIAKIMLIQLKMLE